MTMQPEQALRARIVLSAARPLIETRIYPHKAPQTAARPYVVYSRIAGNPERHMRGAANLASARIQVDSFAATYDVAKQVADAIRMVLDGFKGDVAVNGGTFNFRHISLANELDDFIEPTAGTDDGVYRVSQDWLTFYVLPAPIFI